MRNIEENVAIKHSPSLENYFPPLRKKLFSTLNKPNKAKLENHFSVNCSLNEALVVASIFPVVRESWGAKDGRGRVRTKKGSRNGCQRGLDQLGGAFTIGPSNHDQNQNESHLHSLRLQTQ